jgi:hypothetical protein
LEAPLSVLEEIFPNGPLNIPTDDLAELNFAVGSLVVLWGYTEASLNASVVTVFRFAGGHHHASEIPVAMGRKLKFVRRCLRRIPALAPFTDEGINLMAQVGILAKKRNDIIHGFVTNQDRKTQTFTFTNLGSAAEVALIRSQAKFTPNDIVDIGRVCIPLTLELAQFADRLAQTFVAGYKK